VNAGPPNVPEALQQVEVEIWHLPHELLVAFTVEGVELFRQPGAWDHVDLTEAQRQTLHENDVIVTHNHPLERSFSTQDLITDRSTDERRLEVLHHRKPKDSTFLPTELLGLCTD
jgi:hypothetical protein